MYVGYNYVHGSLPHSFSDNMFTFAHDIYIYVTRQISQITLPCINYTVRSSNSLLCKGPVVWNAIPARTQQTHSLKRFAISLKSIVISRYEDVEKNSIMKHM